MARSKRPMTAEGKIVAKACIDKNMTMEELAIEAKLNRTYLADLIYGARPIDNHLAKFEKILEIDFDKELSLSKVAK